MSPPIPPPPPPPATTIRFASAVPPCRMSEAPPPPPPKNAPVGEKPLSPRPPSPPPLNPPGPGWPLPPLLPPAPPTTMERVSPGVTAIVVSTRPPFPPNPSPWPPWAPNASTWRSVTPAGTTKVCMPPVYTKVKVSCARRDLANSSTAKATISERERLHSTSRSKFLERKPSEVACSHEKITGRSPHSERTDDVCLPRIVAYSVVVPALLRCPI
jgi:hypothetical protein